MTRSYVRTHVGLLDDEDYMVLSPLGIAAWHTVNMLQGQQTEDRFKSRAQIVALLRRHGFGGAATEAMDELEKNHWIIDSPDRPGVELKGWARWQPPSRAEYYRDRRATGAHSGDTDTPQLRTRVFSRPVPSREGRTGGVGGDRGPYVEPDPDLKARIDADIKEVLSKIGPRPKARSPVDGGGIVPPAPPGGSK